MCKIKDVNVGIKKLYFREKRGMMAVHLTDGREMVVPLSFFPDIKKLPLKKREDWMILNEQFFDKRSGKADDFTFQNLTNVYSVTDVVRV